MTETPKPESVELLDEILAEVGLSSSLVDGRLFNKLDQLRATLSSDTDAIRKVRDEMAAWPCPNGYSGRIAYEWIRKWLAALDEILARRK